jgi:hypothetical protein
MTLLTPCRRALALAASIVAVACGVAKTSGAGGGAGGVTVQVAPAWVQVAPGGTAAFSATVSGAVDPSVAWSVFEAGGGSVDAGGSYTAPPTEGVFHVVATSVADSGVSGSAEVDVVLPGSVYRLPPDRATVWKPGVTYNGGIPAARTQCGATLTPSGGNDLAQINAAISACAANRYVLLGPGTFTISGSGQSIGITKSNITLRGSGPGVTVLTRSDGAVDGSYIPRAAAPIIWVGPSRFPGGTSASYDVTGAGAVDGATSVTLASAPASGFTAGQIVLVDELSGATYQPDPSGRGQILMSSDGKVTYQCHLPGLGTDDCRNNVYSRRDRVTQELKEVASWNAAAMTLTFTSPFHTAYRVSNSAQVSTFSAANAPITGVGIEDMTISRGDNGNLLFLNTAYCWAKRVEVTKWLNEGVRFDQSFRGELRDSYVHTPVYFEPGGGSYNIAIDSGSSEILVENSISRDADKVLVTRGAGSGSVVGYNYMDDGHIGSNPGWQEMGLGASHYVGSHHVLFEGNWGYNADNDKTHGNSNTHTYLRNLLRGKRTSYSDGAGNGSVRCAGVTDTTYYMSFVGNVLGAPGQMTGWVYESGSSPSGEAGIWKIGWDDWAPYPEDPLSLSTTIRDGNYDYLTDQVHWHGLGGSGAGNGLVPPPADRLPASLYLSGTPPFFTAGSGYTWPWIDATGPTKALTLPAKARYDAGTPFVQP